MSHGRLTSCSCSENIKIRILKFLTKNSSNWRGFNIVNRLWLWRKFNIFYFRSLCSQSCKMRHFVVILNTVIFRNSSWLNQMTLFLKLRCRCPAIDVAPPCRIVADQNGPYPACCPRVECPPLNVNINEIPDDQIAMGSYDVTLEEDNQVRLFLSSKNWFL